MKKKYPFVDDFNMLAAFNLDIKRPYILKLTNLITNIQYQLKKPNGNTELLQFRVISNNGYRQRIDVVRPRNRSGKLPCLYYSHGGGFVVDILPQHLERCSQYAYQAHCVVVMPHYRLAKAHPFPVGLEDCYTGLKWVLENADMLGVDPQKIGLGGDSAGGCLTASLTQMIRDEKLIKPVFQMLIYPVTSNKMDTPSMNEFFDAPVWNAELNRFMWKEYLKSHDEIPKYAVPLSAESLKNLPPAYVEVAEFDCLRDEGIAYAKRLKASGVAVELNTVKGAIHGFDLNLRSPITQTALKRRINALNNAFI